MAPGRYYRIPSARDGPQTYRGGCPEARGEMPMDAGGGRMESGGAPPQWGRRAGERAGVPDVRDEVGRVGGEVRRMRDGGRYAGAQPRQKRANIRESGQESFPQRAEVIPHARDPGPHSRRSVPILSGLHPSPADDAPSLPADHPSLLTDQPNARITKRGIHTDFIDRSREEWGNLQPLYLDAIRAAEAQDDVFEGSPVAPPEHLVAMKLAAGTDKDERDAVRLIAKVKDLDISATRDLVRRFLGPGLLGRLEECLRRAGQPLARRAYTAGS